MRKDSAIWTTIVIPVIVAIISYGITYGIYTSNPDVNVTVLEKTDVQNNKSVVYTILQNVGTSPANKIQIYYNFPSTYVLNSFNSTESIPKLTVGEDNKSRVEINRLSSDSYTILNMEGKLVQGKEKKLVVTYDKGSKSLTLPYSHVDMGVSSMPFGLKRGVSYLTEFTIGSTLIILTQYLVVRNSESTRRDFLGIYDIDIRKFNTQKVLVGIVVILISILALAPIEYYITNPTIPKYIQNVPFEIEKNISVDQFIHIKKSDWLGELIINNIGIGNIVLFFVIIWALGYSLEKPHLIKYRWFLKSKLANVKVKDIASSYLKVKEVIMEDIIDRKLREKRFDLFYVVWEEVEGNKKIVALLAHNEIVYTHRISDEHTVKAILLNPYLPKPQWSARHHKRDNFVEIDETENLEFVKNTMEKSGKKYAIVIDIHKKPVGVIDYDLIF